MIRLDATLDILYAEGGSSDPSPYVVLKKWSSSLLNKDIILEYGTCASDARHERLKSNKALNTKDEESLLIRYAIKKYDEIKLNFEKSNIAKEEEAAQWRKKLNIQQI